MKISFFTTKRKNDTGITNYSECLMKAIQDCDDSIKLLPVVLTDEDEQKAKGYFARRQYFSSLGKEMNDGQIAHVQHEYSLFGLWINPWRNMFKPFRRNISVPLVLTVHEIEERKKSKTILKNLIKKLYYPLLAPYLAYVNVGMFQDCDHIIVHSQEAKQKLLSRSIASNKISVIPHGVPEFLESTLSIREAKKQLGVDDKFVITTYGYITERKGQDLCLHILNHLPEHVVYVIAGDAPKETAHQEFLVKLRAFVQEMHLEDRVRITGFIPEEKVKDIMRATDVFLYPSRQITASGVVNDGIAYHKVILASDLPFVKEINALVPCIKTFHANDTQDLLKELLVLIGNPDESSSFEQATKKYQKLYNYKKAALQTIEIYRNVLTPSTSSVSS